MLKLKKVQILGFKSFCDRTELLLAGEGIAAIVGPNGCGKSNISDAITWVLGEQSAKSLRGLKMEDVIFAGTRERRPTGMAEVSLTLVDPEVYDSGSDLPEQDASSDLTLTDRSGTDRSMTDRHLTDWDEAKLRARHLAETEAAVAEAQPGAPAAELDGEDSPIEERGNDVVLKIRRRKFGRSAVRAGELTVTRRLFRSGDSEYLLNGKIARLRDIQDIFMGTGLGGESYAIIGQERIGQLLSAKPSDRRSIVEEAAGITRFKTKKRLAELRLGSARENLARINDIFDEVTKQMGTLKRQAAKAERFGELRDELRAKGRVVLRSRLAQLDRDRAAVTSEVATLTERIDTCAAQIETLDGEHRAGTEEGLALDRAIREQAATANQAAVELERVRAQIAANDDRCTELRARLQSGADELRTTEEQLATLSTEAKAQERFLSTVTEENESVRENVRREQAGVAEAVRAVGASETNLEASRRAALTLNNRLGQLRNEQSAQETALQGLEAESTRLLAESATAREELAALGQQRGQVALSFESVNDRLRRLELEIAALRLTIEEARTGESTARRRGDQLRSEVAKLAGRRDSLDGLLRDHAYSTDTVKGLLRASAKPRPGMHPVGKTLGTLADFVEVDAAYEGIVEEFLREELNFVVVAGWEAANEGVRLLRSEVAGRATFLVELEGADSAAAPAGPEPGGEGVRRLSDCMRGLNGLGRSLPALLPRLRRSWIAPDVDTARMLAEQHPDAFFLAPTGETFGHRTVTSGRTSSGGPLALKRELKEIDAQLEATRAELAAIDTQVARLGHELTLHGTTLEAQTAERREAEREAAHSGAALRQMESESARIERRLGEWMLATDRNRDAHNAKVDARASRAETIATLEAEHAAAEAAHAGLEAAVDTARSRRETLQAAAAEAAAALAALEERRRNAQANAEQTGRQLRGQQARFEQIQTQLHSASNELARREVETIDLGKASKTLTDTRADADAEGHRLTALASALRETNSTRDTSLRALRVEAEQLREGRAGLSARLAKLSSDLEHVEQQTLDDLAIPASELRADTAVQTIADAALTVGETDLRALRHRLEQMGPVNMMALEEYTEVAERHTFLEAQRKDLYDSIANTEASIKEIDDVSRVKFDEAFKAINENFGVTFTKLFGGGQALMRLTDPESTNSDASGIEIVASPPGKKLQNILLLSGGEKALTALALLVGIFQFQPAPFCILDEVDAPLDETNVGRYAIMIAEMARDTQFIAITHNKRTMQQANVIYGVTMQEPGVSKIVSVNLGQGNRTARVVRAA